MTPEGILIYLAVGAVLDIVTVWVAHRVLPSPRECIFSAITWPALVAVTLWRMWRHRR